MFLQQFSEFPEAFLICFILFRVFIYNFYGFFIFLQQFSEFPEAFLLHFILFEVFIGF